MPQKSNKPTRAITHRKGKKRNQKMVASENRRLAKEEWEKYNKDWNAKNIKGQDVKGDTPSSSDVDSDVSEEALPIDMVDDEYTESNMGFINKVEKIKRKDLNDFETQPRSFKNDSGSDDDENYNSLVTRDEDGNFVTKKLKKKSDEEIQKVKDENSRKAKKAKSKAEKEETNASIDADKPANSDDEAADKVSNQAPPPESTIELLQQRNRKIVQKKELLMKMSEKVTSEPNNLAHLKQLKKLVLSIKDKNILHTDPEVAVISGKFTILTCCEIFVDILPNYTIRDRSDWEEPKVRISKDVKNKWDVDEATLSAYQEFLTLLETEIIMHTPEFKKEKIDVEVKIENGATAIRKQKVQTQKSKLYSQLKPAAIRAYCQLLIKCTDTNYHKNICQALVNCLSLKENRNRFTISEICNSIKELFVEDQSGSEACCNVVLAIADFTRKNKYNLPADVFNTFLVLNIKEINKNKKQQIYDEKQQIKNRMKMAGYKLSKADKQRLKELKHKGKAHFSKADVKKFKEQHKIDETMDEMSSTVKKDEKLKNHTIIIENIFSLYFAILKSNKKQNFMRNLYKPALMGLAKFSHLINIEFHSDLFKNFIKCIKDDTFSNLEKLQVCKTASILLKGEGESLNIDCHSLQLFTYNQINRVGKNETTHWVLILDLIDDLLLKRRRSVNSRTVCYFVGNLCLASIDLLKNLESYQSKNLKDSSISKENQIFIISLLAMVRKILAAFGVTAANILDQTSLEKAIEIDRTELPVVAKPTTICILKELNLIQSKSQNLMSKNENYKILNKIIRNLITDIRAIGKRATGVKTVMDGEGEEVTTNTSSVEVAGRGDSLWLSVDSQQMVDRAGEELGFLELNSNSSSKVKLEK